MSFRVKKNAGLLRVKFDIQLLINKKIFIYIFQLLRSEFNCNFDQISIQLSLNHGSFNMSEQYNSKALGRNKHNRHKQQKDKHSKFKPKTLPVHPTRIVLESNWSFYSNDVSSEDESSSAPDFEEVMRSSANVGSHFKFKSEKNVEYNEDFKSSLFQIDGKMLECALSTIPFYERIGVDSSYFTADELEDQDQIATENEEKYRKMCENRSKEIIKGKNKKLPEIPRPVRFVEETELETDSTRDDLDEVLEKTRSFHIVVEPVLKFKSTSDNTAVVSAVEPESKESMQKWLDDLLS
uniref:CSON012277 protein n=1 Tax=Culicoides sonorensis TaxID=179676 RepID=A0A336LM20_CULSO